MPDNRLIELEQSLKQIQSSISVSKNKVESLQQAYTQTSSQGLTKQAQEIAKEIEATSGSLGLLDQQKRDIESQIVQISQTPEPHQNISHPTSNKGHLKSKEDKESTDSQEVIEKPIPQNQTSPIDAPSPANNPPTKPKITTPKQIKKQLKANLAAGQPKKNLRLIRQQGAQKAKIPATSPLTQIIQTSSAITADSSAPSTNDAQAPSTSPITSTSPIIATSAVVGTTIKALSTGKKILQFTRNIVKTIKTLGTVIKGAAGPIGLAMTAAKLLAPLIKKIKKVLAILGGLLALHFLMQLMHLVGLVVGLAFGAISGLPLLLIPGVGPFLYAGWVGFWGYRGLTNPFGTIQLATHPWELITKPLTWVGQRFSDLGAYFKGGTEYVGSGVGNVASSAFYGAANFVTGLGQSILGGIASTAGNFAGWLGGVAGNAFGAASATLTSSASGIIVLAGKITMVAFGAGGLAVAATNMLAMSTTEGDLAGQFLAPGQNDLFTITKTTSTYHIPNPPAFTPLTFTITITAKQPGIKPVSLADNAVVSNGGPIGQANNPCMPLPQTIDPGTPFVCTVIINATVDHADSNITNTAALTATSADGSQTETGASSATVEVGTVVGTPDPSGWATCGEIWQGPGGPPTHTGNFASSIDIHNPEGTKIYATHDGTVSFAGTGSDNEIYVALRGTSHITFYVHLQSIAPGIFLNTPVTKGDLLGYMDTTGNLANSSHLHYMIRDLNNITISVDEFNNLIPAYSLYDTVGSSYGPC